MIEPKWTPGPWVRDRYGSVRGSNGREVTLHHAGLGLNLGGGGSAEQIANTALVMAATQLHHALYMEVANCPMCKGDGETAETFEHIMGQIEPGKRVKCPRCATSREVLAKAEGSL